MKPPAFEYAAPDSLAEVLDILAAAGPEAKLLAGGQSLIPLLNFRLVRPRILVDLRRVPDLDRIELVDGTLVLGAMTRQRTVEHARLVADASPMMVQATRHIAHLPIRTRGTIGGSLAHADPAAEYPVAALALDATLVVRGPAGERIVPAREFFVSYLTTALEPEDVLLAIRVPRAGPGSGSAFVELARRPGDFAIVAVAATVELDPELRAVSVALAVGGAAPAPFRATAAEAALVGRRVDDTAIAEAARLAAEAAAPESDLQATADYRRSMCQVLAARALAAAAGRATRVVAA